MNHQICSIGDVSRILTTNFDFKEIDDPIFGKVIEMKPKEAFEFSLITGANYLFVPIGYTIKGRMDVAIHRSIFQNNSFIFSYGLFSRDLEQNLIEGDSILHMYKKYPVIFTGKKKLALITIYEHSCIEEEIYNKIMRGGCDPSEYLIYKVFSSGSNLEPFHEYVACRRFAERGLLTENQAPWFNQAFVIGEKRINGGIPDVSAFSSPDLYELSLRIPLNFINIQLLSGIFLTDGNPGRILNKDYELIIGEAKVSSNGLVAAINQLLQYNETGVPTELYTVIHDVEEPPTQEIGVFYIDNLYNTEIEESEEPPKANEQLRLNDSIWLSNIINFYLISNLEFTKIELFIRENCPYVIKDKIKSKDLVNTLCSVSYKQVLEYVLKNITFRGVW